MDVKEKFGNKVKKIRLEKNLSQEKLSFKSKVHRTYISGVERGLKNISIENIEKISKGLGVEIKDLF